MKINFDPNYIRRLARNFQLRLFKKKVMYAIVALVLSTTLILATCYYLLGVAEKHYFDKLLYKKSSLHGYFSGSMNAQWSKPFLEFYTSQPFLIQRRLKDLHLLISNYNENKVTQPKSGFQTVSLIGDSMTYGTGVRIEQNLAHQLQDSMSRKVPTKVYNLSLPGDDIVDAYIKLVLSKKYLPSDLYIINLIPNDTHISNIDRYPEKKEILLELEKVCGNNLLNYEAGKYEEFVANSYTQGFDNYCYLRQILTKLSQHRDIILALYDNFTINNQCSITTKEYHLELFFYALFETGLPFVNLRKIQFADQDETMKHLYVSKSETHPSAETTKRFAQEITETIYDKK